MKPKATGGVSANTRAEGTFPDLSDAEAGDVRNRTPAVLGTAAGHITAARFMLPLPPSANRLWRMSGTRVHKSAHYNRWRSQASWMIKAALGGTKGLPGAYSLRVRAIRPNERGRDLDNLLKPLCDALKDGGAIASDDLAKSITMEWCTGAEIGTDEGMEVVVM